METKKNLLDVWRTPKRSRPQKLFAGLTVLLGTLVGLVVAEALVRILAPQEVKSVIQAVSPSGILVSKASGEAFQTVSGRRVSYRFRAPGARADGLSDGRNRVLALGESFTFGWGLEGDETFLHHLEVAMRTAWPSKDLAIVNGAFPAWSLAHYLRYLEEYGEAVGPCLVAIFLNTDDIGRIAASGLYALEDGRLVARPGRVSLSRRLGAYFTEHLPWLERLISESHALWLLRYALSEGARPSLDPEALAQVFREGPTSSGITDHERLLTLAFAIADAIIDWARARNIDVAFFTTGWHVPPYDDREVTRAFMLRAPSFFLSRGVPFHDPSAKVFPRRAQLPWYGALPGDGHPSPQAARIIAEELWPAFSKVVAASRCVAE